jgi:predicted ATP-binding protein involved in virulence
MDLQGIKIQKLFGQFDYTISLNQNEGITILTGPNGYGKTTILNIIYNFFKQNFFFFQKLIFQDITFSFPEEKNVVVTKGKREEAVQIGQDIDDIDDEEQVIPEGFSFVDVDFILKDGEKVIEIFTFNFEIANKLFKNISKLNPEIERVSQNQLHDSRTRNYMDVDDYLLQSQQKFFDILNEYSKQNNQIEQFLAILSCVDVYLIKEQRLLKPIYPPRRFIGQANNRHPFSYTIQSYAVELKNLIHQKQAEAFQESQKLDNSFPSRLMQNEKSLSPKEFDSRFMALTKKQQQLQQFGITISNIQIPEFNKSKADVLAVYLDDSEKKTDLFDDLVTKINLFVTIINDKEFAHKKINIDGEAGFYFITDEGHKLNLTALSSGEQEEVVVLYELLFRTQPNALILIDEPEISLHVSWQKTFVDDLLSISDIKHISFLLATHSPQVINSRWDMTTDLYKLTHGEVYLEDE